MKKSVLLFFAITIVVSISFAQSTKMFIPLDIKKAYDKQTRSLDGKPGPNYWQNSSNYQISAELDPVKMTLSGTENIVYKNNSPNKLTMIVVRLYNDIFKKGTARDFSINPRDLTDGVTISKITINGEAVELTSGKPLAARRDGTNMRITLKNAIEAKSEAKIEIEWSYQIAKNTTLRGGVYGPTTFFISYWYPQMAVYDDTDGWDTHSYKGTVEFYNDFCNYDVKITVPEKYIVWATGILQNGEENFQSETREKIEAAHKSDKVINIIKKEDIEKGNITKAGAKLTWHYKAEHVPDFVFAAGSEMVWDASNVKLPNGKDAFVSSINNKDAKYCEEIADYARKSVEHFSTKMPGIPYPYPAMTVFNHPGGGGMEYPMMVNDGIGQNKEGAVGVTAHEIAHTYMPFYMGINERKYAWMDEGWAVMLTYDAEQSILPESKPRNNDGATLSFIMGQEEELPMIVNSNIMAGGEGSTYSVASYPRAGVALDLLRGVLGEELFKKATKEYVERWNGKHPIPYDFFATYSDVAGENLDWFWIPWYFERGYPDLGIKDVTLYEGTYKTTIQKDGIMPVPVNLKYVYEDGTSEEVTRPVTIWKGGNKEYVVEYKPAKKVDRIELGASNIPDVNRANNKFLFKKEDPAKKANLKDYEGTYDVEGMIVTITIEGEKLIASATGQTSLEMNRIGTDEYELSGAPVKIKFIRDENKKVISMNVDQNGREMKAKKIN